MDCAILSRHRIRRVAVLTNPASGKGRAGEISLQAHAELVKRGIDVVSLAGASPKASRDLAKYALDMEEIDALVVCGGDGLINLALQEQAGHEKPLGIIPAGTGNDTAREYRIPLDVEEAVEVIAGGYATRADLGIISSGGQEKYFGTIAHAGFDSLVVDRTNRIKWPKGPLRYVLAVLMEAPNFKARPLKIVSEGETLFDDRAMLIAIGNTRTYGGGMKIIPQADHHDGKFDITVLADAPRRRMLPKFPAVMNGDFSELSDIIHQFRVSEVDVKMEGAFPYADGDKAFDLPASFRVEKAAGNFLVPKP